MYYFLAKHKGLNALIESRTAELRTANEQLQAEIAQHKKTEDALRSSESYYRTIFHNTGTAIIIMEEDTTISLSNAECEKFVRYRPTDLEGKEEPWSLGFSRHRWE